MRFQVYFTPLPGFFSPFPHGTSSLSVAKEYLALRGGPRGFRPGFPCPAVLRNLSRKAMRFHLRGHCPLWRDVPVTSANARLCNFPTRRQTDQDRPYNTHVTTTAVLTSHRFGLFPFRSPLLRESRFLSFPPVTKMFQFTGLPSSPYVFRRRHARTTTRRFPHSEIPGSKVGQHLTRAYRSRPRPSSALGAKASTVCP